MTETPLSAVDGPAVHFATSLVPHRSLSPEGFKWLIRGAIAANLLIGLPMLLLGAWPVLGFMGLDVWLLWFLFKRSYLDARRSETLLLTDRELIVDRVAPRRRARAAPARRLLAAGRPSRQGLGAAGAGLARQSRGDRPLSRPGRAPEGRRAAQGGARRHARAALRARVGFKAPARPSCRTGRASCRKAIAPRGSRPRHRSRG